jgi:hypothetical protein
MSKARRRPIPDRVRMQMAARVSRSYLAQGPHHERDSLQTDSVRIARSGACRRLARCDYPGRRSRAVSEACFRPASVCGDSSAVCVSAEACGRVSVAVQLGTVA